MRQVCGLDVHKDTVFVCILNENGIVFQEKYGVLTTELEQMLEVMMQHDVTEVCMESTSVYWMPIWRVLENYIPKLMLVNPYFIKQLPGKKSDVKDAEWIATCLLKDLIKGSYVPEDRIQQLRQYDRRIFDLNKEITYKLTKLDMALQRCNIRISNYVATTDGKSYQDVVRLISEGKTSPEELAKVIHGRTVNKHGLKTIIGALTGVISGTDMDIIRQLREEILLDQKHKDECQSKMDELCQKWFPTQLKNLQTIPGVKTRSATAIIAELGTDMSSFEDAAHLVSWCGLKPRNEESAGKIKSRSITHGNKYLRKTLIECSWASSKTQGCFYNKFSYIQTVVRRKNKMKVQVAIARKMLSAIWFILHDNVAYRDYTPDIASADELSVVSIYTAYCKVIIFVVAKDPVFKLTHALCGLGRPFETLNSKRKLFYYHSVTPQYRTRGVNLLYAQRTAMPHSPTSDRCDQLIFRGNIQNI